MKKRMMLVAGCFLLIGSMAQAASTIAVPGQYASIQAAIDAAKGGDTIRIGDSKTYVEDLAINKPVKIVAKKGQSPIIQDSGAGTKPQIVFNAKSGGAQIGSASGGQITVQYLKVTTGTTPAAMIQFHQTTGTQVVLENLDIITTGPAYGIPITAILHDQAIANIVALRHVNIDINRASFTDRKLGSAYGIVIGGMDNKSTLDTGGDGPTYNLDHVRIKNYTRAAIWPNFVNARINMSYCDCGKLGDTMAGPYPYGPIAANSGAAPWSGTLDHCVFYGPFAYHTVRIGANGSSVTLNRCAVISKYAFDRRTAIGSLYLTANQLPRPGRVRVTVDHCDIVDLSRAGWNTAAIVKDNPGNQFTTITLTVNNSNVYSQHNKAVNMIMVNNDSFQSDYNNVFGTGVNVGYKAGEHDLSVDPQYADPQNGDMRYKNTKLNQADSTRGPIGVGESYSNVWAE